MLSRLRALEVHRFGYAIFWSCSLYIVLEEGGSASTLANNAWTQQLALVVGLVLAVLLRRRATAAPSVFAGGAMSLAGLAYVIASMPGCPWHVPAGVVGVLLGLSNVLQFLLWQKVYANEGPALSSVYLSLSTAAGSLVSLLLYLMPGVAASFYLVVVAPFATLACLQRCFAEMNPYPERPLGRALARPVLADLWRPILCSVITCLAWSFSKHLVEADAGGSGVILAAGFCVASLLVVVLGLLTSYDFGAPNVYRVVLPLLSAALFAPALIPEGGYALEASLTFGAHLMTLLVSIIAASYAARTQFSPGVVYLAVFLPSQVAILAGDTAGTLLAGQVSLMERSLFMPASALFMALFAVMLVTSRGRGRTLAEPADDTLLINPQGAPAAGAAAAGDDDGADGDAGAMPPSAEAAPAMPELARRCGVTEREAEVLALLLRGNTMSAISRKLYISDNTTRGHMRRIYQKLDVHSRQELIDKLGER